MPEEHWRNPERDERINAETTPPSDECARFVAITTTEAYPPSYLPALEQGLRRLGLYQEAAGRESPLNWIKTTSTALG